VSTPSKQPPPGEPSRSSGAPSRLSAALTRPIGAGHPDQADLLGLVARASRRRLLAKQRHRLRREELEDCYSQATLELLASLRAGRRFSGRLHLGRVLEQRFLSRVADRRRAIAGRSPLPAALERALPLDARGAHAERIADPRADVHTLVVRRHELSRIRDGLSALTPDQRLVLASQALLDADRSEFCHRHGWSHAKYRKVALRARTRLRAALAAELPPAPSTGCPARRPAGDGSRRGGPSGGRRGGPSGGDSAACGRRKSFVPPRRPPSE